MASNLREINILTCFSGVEEKWGGVDKEKMRRREDEKEDGLVFNSLWLYL